MIGLGAAVFPLGRRHGDAIGWMCRYDNAIVGFGNKQLWERIGMQNGGLGSGLLVERGNNCHDCILSRNNGALLRVILLAGLARTYRRRWRTTRKVGLGLARGLIRSYHSYQLIRSTPPLSPLPLLYNTNATTPAHHGLKTPKEIRAPQPDNPIHRASAKRNRIRRRRDTMVSSLSPSTPHTPN